MLTLEEVDSLEAGPELNLLVAQEVMKLKPCSRWRSGSGAIAVVHSSNECDVAPPDQCYDVRGENIDLYSSHIAAAWTVVEKLKDIWPQGFYMTYLRGEGWGVAWKQDHMGPTEDGAIWNVATAPLAICRAALKACLRS